MIQGRPIGARLGPLAVAALAGALGGCGGDAARSADPGGEPDPRVGVESLEPDSLEPERAESPDGSAAPEPALLDPTAAEFVDAEEGVDAPLPLAPERACAASRVEAVAVERVVEEVVEVEVVVPSVFYVMLDSSGSMLTDRLTLAGLIEAVLDLFGLGQMPPQPTKWDYAVAGLKEFVNDPESSGLELALGYFPDAGAACDGVGYDVPSVPLGELPGSAASLEASLDARVPTGGTPLEGALRGATTFCLEFNRENPDASCVPVLITDGAAEQCDARGSEALSAIAADARAEGVLTYAAGMQGADFAVLDAIGEASGADCDPGAPGFACDLTRDRTAFVESLRRIRDTTRSQVRVQRRVEREVQPLPCEWEIPRPPAGQRFDPRQVNVQLVAPAAEPESLAGVESAAACGERDGWFYDDASAPTRILSCPKTCAALERAADTRVELLFGCETLLR